MVIGIAGGTGSGKTTVVKKIMQLFPKHDVALLSQDNYYKDNGHLPMEERQKINFDHPESVEFSLLEKHIKDLKHDIPIEEPIYSYLTCERSAKTVHIEPKKVIRLSNNTTIRIAREMFLIRAVIGNKTVISPQRM